MNEQDRKAFNSFLDDANSPDDKYELGAEHAWQACCKYRDGMVGEPIGWRVAFTKAPRGGFHPGRPDERTLEYWRHQGVDFEYCYASPPTTQINQALVEALKPLAEIDIHPNQESYYEDDLSIFLRGKSQITVGDVRRAQAALQAARGEV